MPDEELIALQDELAAARAEAERISEQAADGQARAAHMEEAATGLRQELAQAREQMTAREQELATAQAELVEARTQMEAARDEAKAAALKYKEAVLVVEPWLPAEMVSGETVAAIDESLTQARRTVAQVRQQLEEQAQQARVPTGAPTRRPPDLSALSPAEKIKLGLQQRREQG